MILTDSNMWFTESCANYENPLKRTGFKTYVENVIDESL